MVSFGKCCNNLWNLIKVMIVYFDIGSDIYVAYLNYKSDDIMYFLVLVSSLVLERLINLVFTYNLIMRLLPEDNPCCLRFMITMILNFTYLDSILFLL